MVGNASLSTGWQSAFVLQDGQVQDAKKVSAIQLALCYICIPLFLQRIQCRIPGGPPPPFYWDNNPVIGSELLEKFDG